MGDCINYTVCHHFIWRKKTARTGPGIGVGLKEFKQATREIKDEVQNAANEVNGDEKEPHS